MEMPKTEQDQRYSPFTDERWPDVHPLRKPDELRDGKMETLEVNEAGAAGKGIFARAPFRTGQEIFVFDGTKSTEQLKPDLFETGGNPNAIVVGREFAMEPDPFGKFGQTRKARRSFGKFIWANPADTSPLRFLNHSCEPNIARAENDPFQFVALRDIKPGEQLVADYSLIETNPEWNMECRCGSPNCRKEVGGITSLPTEKLAGVWHNIPRFMQEYALEQSTDLYIKDLIRKEPMANIIPRFPELVREKTA